MALKGSVHPTLYHTPVLANETLSYLVTVRDGVYVDGTLGGGGHAESILEHLQGGRLIGFDRDDEAISVSKERLQRFGDCFHAVHAPFSEMRERLAKEGLSSVHGILLDLGVSSHHLDEPSRGFSFQADGPLDMRMDRRSGMSGADVVNTYDEKNLAHVLFRYGEEREAKRIARAIVEARPLSTTTDLSDIVRNSVIPPQATKALARVFQAIRIEVNGELQELQTTLNAIPDMLATGGRLVVLTYHSLEDRIVKDFIRSHAAKQDSSVSRFLPERQLTPNLKDLHRKPVRPSDEEAAVNPRARSAKLRSAEKI